MIMAQKSNVVDIKDLISARLNKLSAEHLAKSEMMRPSSPHNIASLKHLSGLDSSIQKLSALSPSHQESAQQILETNRENNEDAEEEDKEANAPETATVQMNPDELFIQYGPDTIQELSHLLSHSFKVFWDGSISLYNDTVHSSTNNKDFLNKLLDVRMHSD